MSKYGKYFQVELGGTSHGPEVWVRINGVPEGSVIDFEELDYFMSRRSAQNLDYATERKEPDDVNFRKGVVHFGATLGIVTEKEIEAFVQNKDVDSSEYEAFRKTPRPGHADFTALMKDGMDAEIAGGGRFSGRLTVGLCVAGGIAKQLLEKRGVEIMTDIIEIGGDRQAMDFEDVIMSAKAKGDSVGGIIECGVLGLAPGSCGDSYFDGLEGKISEAVFGIPAVKGVEFGNGFQCSELLGSENNDAFYFDEDGSIKTKTNNHGGILGGIASGMPIVLRCAVKPTPSIAIEQDTVNLETGENAKIKIEGRHDPCIVPRALPCVEAAVAIAVLDALMEEEARKANEVDVHSENFDPMEEARKVIDEQDQIILEALKARIDAARIVGIFKKSKGMAITDPVREDQVLMNAQKAGGEYGEAVRDIYKKIIEKTKEIERQ